MEGLRTFGQKNRPTHQIRTDQAAKPNSPALQQTLALEAAAKKEGEVVAETQERARK